MSTASAERARRRAEKADMRASNSVPNPRLQSLEVRLAGGFPKFKDLPMELRNMIW